MAEARTFRFEFPMPPNPNKNKATNARSGHHAKKAYYRQLDELQQIGRLPAPPKLPLMRVLVSAAVFIWNKMDDDNASHRMKWPQDWLKKRGYIVDDRRPFLQWIAPPEQTCDRSGRPEVIIMHIKELVE